MVILDIRLPPSYTDEGMRAALTLREQRPELGVLVLSSTSKSSSPCGSSPGRRVASATC